MTLRRMVTLLVAASLLLSACTDDSKKQTDGLPVEILAGGGTDPLAARGLDAKITGIVKDLEVGRDGVVRLLSWIDGKTSILLIHPDGTLQRINLGAAGQLGDELAVADDGTMYVGYDFPGGFGIANVTAAGKVTRVVGGLKGGETKDGLAATGPADAMDGLTVDRQGRLVYSELRGPSNQVQKLIRRVEVDGTVKTIAGKIMTFKGSDDYEAAQKKSGAPPEGTRALDWPLPGDYQTRTLSTGDDGTIYAESLNSVLAFAPDGTVSAPVQRRPYDAAKIGDRPFAREGDAVDADPDFAGTEYHNVSAGGGYLAMLTESGRSGRPPAFRWTGDLTPAQRQLADAEPSISTSGDPRQVVRLVLPDRSVTTAAWWAEGVTVHDGWLYLVTGDKTDNLLIARVKLPA